MATLTPKKRQRVAYNILSSAAQAAAYFLFSVQKAEPNVAPLFVWLSEEDCRLQGKETSIDRGYEMSRKFKKEGYVLFIDDERMPFQVRFPFRKSAVVARDVKSAIQCVERIGCPEKICFDFYLKKGDVMEFVFWFENWLEDPENKIHPDFSYDVHSAADHAKATIDAVMKKYIRNTGESPT